MKQIYEKDPRKIDGGLNEANLAKNLLLLSTFDEESKSGFKNDIIFVITSIIFSHSLIINSSIDTWFANNSTSKHMTDRYD